MQYKSTNVFSPLITPSLKPYAIKSYAISFSVSIASFIVGVCATLLFDNLFNGIFLAIFIFVFGFLTYMNRAWLPLFVLLIGFSWATFVFTLHFNNRLPEMYESKTIAVTGQIQSLPEYNSRSSRFRFKVRQANSISGQVISELANQSIVLSCYHCRLSFEPDQQWRFSVRLKRPHSYASWGAFDYEKYLFRHQIIATGYVRVKDKNELLKSATTHTINQWRWEIRNSLDQVLPGAQLGKAILAALMIGDKSHFSQEQQLVFQKSGISHLMAISGLHIGLAFIVMVWLLKWMLTPLANIFYWMPRQTLVLVPALSMALFYAALAGFSISTQRAMIMLSMFVLARFFTREVSLLKVLMITVGIIFIYDPLSILDVGFWLSCSAVMVIGLTAEYQKENTVDREDAGYDETTKLSLLKLQPLLWLGMLPITLLFFGGISMLSPAVNLVMVPLFCGVLIPITLLALVLKLIDFQLISNTLIEGLAYCYEKIYWGLHLATELPFAQLALPAMRSIDWILFLFVAFAYFYVWRIRHMLLLVLSICLISLTTCISLAEDEFKVTLLDVGQGLSMVVEVSNYVLVYDTGPAYSSGFNTADAVLIPYLQQQGIREIDTLIISHADNDHIGGLPALQEAIKIKKIISSRVDKIPSAVNCQSGQSWSVANIEFKILSPDINTPSGSNNHSCVLMVSNKHKKILISGDIEHQVERFMLNNNVDLLADILLVPHQGSKTSSTSRFIEAVAPQIALIAAGYKNHYGHPHGDVVKRYLDRNIKLVSTIESGSITLNINKNIVNVIKYRQTNKGFWNHIKT